MSKLLKLYSKLKQENPETLYLFKSGIFCIAIDDDALTLSELFDFKIIDLNANSIKCGFPISKLNYYSSLLNINNVKFEIIDPNTTSRSINKDFLVYQSIINEILKVNFDKISFKDAFFKFQKIQDEVKKINNLPTS